MYMSGPTLIFKKRFSYHLYSKSIQKNNSQSTIMIARHSFDLHTEQDI